MRTVVAVDWSEQSFNAVKIACRLFTQEAVTLIHAVDLRPFENPLFAQPLGRKSAGAMREGMVAAGERLLDQTSALVPATIPSIQRVYKIGNPAPVVLEAIRSAHADLVAVGSQGRGRLAELVLGSVSHRVVLHAPCAALLVRGDPGSIRRVLLTVEGYEDFAQAAQLVDHASVQSADRVVPLDRRADHSHRGFDNGCSIRQLDGRNGSACSAACGRNCGSLANHVSGCHPASRAW
ncbi:MAG: universal stress protein [Nitrospira sp.]